MVVNCRNWLQKWFLWHRTITYKLFMQFFKRKSYYKPDFGDPLVMKVKCILIDGCLSKGGKLTLVQQCMLSSIPPYYLSLSRDLMKIFRPLKNLNMNFLWEQSGEDLKDHFLSGQWYQDLG